MVDVILEVIKEIRQYQSIGPSKGIAHNKLVSGGTVSENLLWGGEQGGRAKGSLTYVLWASWHLAGH